MIAGNGRIDSGAPRPRLSRSAGFAAAKAAIATTIAIAGLRPVCCSSSLMSPYRVPPQASLVVTE
jgi:hypothetical protein